jgi:PAS domain S-box-containing protein
MHPSEIPLNVLAEAAGDGVILIDDQSTILFVNPAAGQIFGYEPTEMVGDDLTSLMPEYLRQIHLTSLKRYIATGQRHISWQNVQLTGLHKSGREFPIEVSFTEYTSQGRRFFTGFVRDVTERKQAEEALRVRADELQVRRARQAALVAEIHAAFASKTHGDLRSILQASAESVVRHLDAAFARIWTLNNQENLLQLQASAGQYTGLNGEYARMLVGELHIGGIAQERKPYIANDLVNDPRTEHPEWAEQERIIALAGYPLMVEGRLVGVLAMFARQALGSDTLEALALVADTIAQGAERKQAEEGLRRANEQLHVLSRRLFQIQENERRHLARELHDQLGQALTAAKIDLQAAQSLEERTAIVRRLDDSIAILERLLQQVRQLSLELRPPLLDDLGLVPALRWYLDQQAQRADLRVEFFADPALERVDAAIETACFRVAQEALTNVVRHARAQTVSVELDRTPEALHLVVRDDGIGFDVVRAQQSASLGLLGMRERVALVGGELDCKSAPGRGTEVHAFFPVRFRPDAQEPRP